MKSAAKALTYEKVPFDTSKLIRRKAVQKMTNDITKLPTSAVLGRLYKRHSVGLWESVCIITWIAVLWLKIG